MNKSVKIPLQIPYSNCALTRELTRRGRKPKSQTPGKDKVITCQLTAIGGFPRKAYIRSRAYKLRGYAEFCAFADSVNGGRRSE